MSNIGPVIQLNTSTFALDSGSSYVTPAYDFPFANYIYTKGFFNELSRIQSNLASGAGSVTVDGKELSFQDLGDLLSLQQYMTSLEGAKATIEGLGKKGLSVQYKALTNLYSQ